MKSPIIMTHCGQLGDFIYAWPVASWVYQSTGRKVHWVLPRGFGPFRAIKSLAMCQEFCDGVTLVDHPVTFPGLGGQPYKFNPWMYLDDQWKGDCNFYNLGFRAPPDKFVPAFIGEEHGLGWDPDWVLSLEHPTSNIQAPNVEKLQSKWLEDCHTEHANFPKGVQRIDLGKDVLWNARLMASAKRRHCWHSSMAVILYFARVPFHLYRDPNHPPAELYFPRRERYVECVAGQVANCTQGIHPTHL